MGKQAYVPAGSSLDKFQQKSGKLRWIRKESVYKVQVFTLKISSLCIQSFVAHQLHEQYARAHVYTHTLTFSTPAQCAFQGPFRVKQVY